MIKKEDAQASDRELSRLIAEMFKGTGIDENLVYLSPSLSPFPSYRPPLPFLSLCFRSLLLLFCCPSLSFDLPLLPSDLLPPVPLHPCHSTVCSCPAVV